MDRHPEVLARIDKLRRAMALDIGWHYLLDLIWILTNLHLNGNRRVLDAGAGKGLLQFLLAEHGYSVVSADYSNRSWSPLIRFAYSMEFRGEREFHNGYLDHMASKYTRGMNRIKATSNLLGRSFSIAARVFQSAFHLPEFLLDRMNNSQGVGRIIVYKTDILSMTEIEDSSIDAVVSLSVIEHLKKSQIPIAFREFWRVLKPGGHMLITTSAAQDQDWYHEPSKGYCFSEESIRDFLGIADHCSSNWQMFDEILRELKSSEALKERLSASYRYSGNNGMPWAVWDPKYVPVGIAVYKQRDSHQCK